MVNINICVNGKKHVGRIHSNNEEIILNLPNLRELIRQTPTYKSICKKEFQYENLVKYCGDLYTVYIFTTGGLSIFVKHMESDIICNQDIDYENCKINAGSGDVINILDRADKEYIYEKCIQLYRKIKYSIFDEIHQILDKK